MERLRQLLARRSCKYSPEIGSFCTANLPIHATVLLGSTVLILDGNSVINAHLLSDLGYLFKIFGWSEGSHRFKIYSHKYTTSFKLPSNASYRDGLDERYRMYSY